MKTWRDSMSTFNLQLVIVIVIVMRYVVLMAFLLLSSTAFGCKLIVRLAEYPPHAYLTPERHWQGSSMALIEALLKQANCDHEIVELPWARALELMTKGDIDMMLNMSKNPAREKFIHFIGPQRQEKIALFSLATTPITLSQFQQLDIPELPIAIQTGAYYGELFARLKASDNKRRQHFLSVPNNKVKLSLLQRGRVSGFIEERLSTLYQIQHNPQYRGMKMHDVVIHSNPVYFALSRASVGGERLSRLQQAFTVLQKSGRLQAILDSYELH